MIPEPMCICFVRAATNGMITSFDEMWEYSQRKWCSVHHEYFQLRPVADLGERDLAHQPRVLGVRVGGHLVLVDEAPHEQPEFHCARPPLRPTAPGRAHPENETCSIFARRPPTVQRGGASPRVRNGHVRVLAGAGLA